MVLLSPTVPWLGLGLLFCLFQKPEPWTCGPARTQPPYNQVLADRCSHLPCCPVYHTRPSSLAVSWFGYSVVRCASPSCSGARQQGLPDQQPHLSCPLRNMFIYVIMYRFQNIRYDCTYCNKYELPYLPPGSDLVCSYLRLQGGSQLKLYQVTTRESRTLRDEGSWGPELEGLLLALASVEGDIPLRAGRDSLLYIDLLLWDELPSLNGCTFPRSLSVLCKSLACSLA